jgi:predicted nucleotidyltransferase
MKTLNEIEQKPSVFVARSLASIKKILLEHKKELKEKYKVKTIGIFGSYARNEQTEQSDIDIMIEFYEPIGLNIVDLKEYLEKILNTEVDLIIKKSIQNPYLKKSIEEDLIYV